MVRSKQRDVVDFEFLMLGYIAMVVGKLQAQAPDEMKSWRAPDSKGRP